MAQHSDLQVVPWYKHRTFAFGFSRAF